MSQDEIHPEPEQVTQLLRAATAGDARASNDLMGIVYDDLRRLANHLMQNERSNHTLQPTALVHEAYMRLIRYDQMQWQDRAHFFAMAARQMRRLLVDHARRHRADRRGSGAPRLSLDEGLGLTVDNETDVLMLDDALEKLEALHPRQAQMVVMRFFGGMSVADIAEVFGVTTRTIQTDWAMARAWLKRELSGA
ncbi:MAG: sigma-70 family RNA polymerase sigma factor [Myxococcales bacterium]|nr:sigma-70 family RNA polymerase sigma factor [Myxococcales bacterium]